jgi:hypothetical protein
VSGHIEHGGGQGARLGVLGVENLIGQVRAAAEAGLDSAFTLGIGPNHRPITEERFGYSYEP